MQNFNKILKLIICLRERDASIKHEMPEPHKFHNVQISNGIVVCVKKIKNNKSSRSFIEVGTI